MSKITISIDILLNFNYSWINSTHFLHISYFQFLYVYFRYYLKKQIQFTIYLGI